MRAFSRALPSEYKDVAIPYIFTGNSYTLNYKITNRGADGDGRIGVDESN